MTQEEYNTVKKPLQEAEALIPKIEETEKSLKTYYQILALLSDANNAPKVLNLIQEEKYKIKNLKAKFTALISNCIKLLIEQRKANSGELNSLYPCPSYYCAMSAYETLFKNQPKD